jgi:5-histidylcysteine sulfoxide synthase/putative 4-mercaptohistidine N1-methyltranferase
MNIIKDQRAKPPLLNGTAVSAKRNELKDYFKQTWAEYESLFSLINDESAYYLRPERLRHPLIFYFGHTATFYINKLILGKFISERVNDKVEAICAVGVDEMSWDDLNSEHYNWPSVNEVRDYRKKVAELIENLIDHMPLSLPITQDSLAWIILMGCEHERIHLETSSVIMRMLPLDYLTAVEPWSTCSSFTDAPVNELMPIKGKLIKFGKPINDDTFGWDNEFGDDQLKVDDFHTSKYVVSNQEYLAFIEAKGYQQSDFWTEEGQQWLAFTKAVMPRFWFKKVNKNNEESYWQRNLLNEIPLPLNWPVEVNYLEAKAFCQWKNSQATDVDKQFIRLPTEAEWFCLRDNIEGDLTTWKTAPGNINNKGNASSCPVNQFEHNGVFDIVGNVWQWTESPIDGFQGFEVHPLYDDFSTPTFDGKHNLIKGGSWISSGNEATKHSRYAFRRHFFQHAGFRYVQSKQEELPNLAVNHYEVDTAICQQLHAQYGQAKSTMPIAVKHYSQQITDELITSIEKHKVEANTCLDLGCGVGRTSFVLAQHFKQVDAVDFSARYIRHGVNLQQGKSVRYILENEGDIVDFYEFNLRDVVLPCSKNICFSQGDVSNLKANLIGYDAIIAQHVLENTYDPLAFLKDVHLRLNAKGLLIIISNYDFDEKKTSKENWLGGLKVNGENVTGFEGLSLALIPNFQLLKQQQLTRPIKINRRNFILSFPHLSVWQLK